MQPTNPQDVRKHAGIHHGAYAVVDDGDIVILQFALEVVHAVAYGFLARRPAGDNPLQLRNAVLPGVFPQGLLPAGEANHLDGVDFGVALEALQRIDDHRLAVDVDELLGDVQTHAAAHAPGDDDCDVHALALLCVTPAAGQGCPAVP